MAAETGIKIVTGFDSASREQLDKRSGPYSSLAAANLALDITERAMGMPIYIIDDAPADDVDLAVWTSGTVKIARYTGGIADVNLVFDSVGGGLVSSVNTQIGDVVLVADDIDDSLTTHKFVDQALIDKVASVESNATADQTGAEIKIAYEAELDTNAFTDAEKTLLGNQSNINTGDETTSSIQTKRPLKTIEGQSLEGSGNIDLSSTDVGLGNVPNVDATNRVNHTGTQTASTISDFDTEVSNNTDVAANTSKLSTIESNAKDDQIANEVPVTPTGNLLSTNVQAGLEELQTKLDNLTPYTFTGNTVPMDKPTIAYNTLVDNTFTLYTLSATVVVGAKAIIRIQTSTTEPNVQLDGGGAVDKILEGDVWVANTEMNLTIENQGGRIVYYFIRN